MTIEIKTCRGFLKRMFLLLPILAAFFACQEEVGYEFVDSSLPESKFSAAVDWFDVTVENSSYHSTHYRWDFGDGTVLDVQDMASVDHRYTEVGTYTIALTAYDDNKAENVSKVDVVITNDPVAGFSYVADFLELSFTNESQRATIFDWTISDKDGTEVASFTSKDVDYTFADEGEYKVSLYAANEGGDDDTYEEVILVSAFAPAFINPSFEGFTGAGDDLKDFWDGNFGTSTAKSPIDGANGCKLDESGEYVEQTIAVQPGMNYIISYDYAIGAAGEYKFYIYDGDDRSIVLYEEVISSEKNSSYSAATNIQFDSATSTSVTVGVAYITADVELRVDNFSIR